MFWVFIVVIFIILLFISSKKEESDKVNRQGGFYLKYNTLINHFLSIPNIEIVKKSNTYIELVVRDPGVATRFTVEHGFGDVTIFWIHESYMIGKHSLHWTFNEYISQYDMLDIINYDMDNYLDRLLNN